jgi:uncharacterized protein YdeI (YjbR/CyaY-like superfamily)
MGFDLSIRLDLEIDEKTGMPYVYYDNNGFLDKRHYDPYEYKIPEEFIYVLEKMQGLKLAFESLSSGRQKAYIFYFSSAKQSKTREARVEKYIPKILFGKGLDD